MPTHTPEYLLCEILEKISLLENKTLLTDSRYRWRAPHDVSELIGALAHDAQELGRMINEVTASPRVASPAMGATMHLPGHTNWRDGCSRKHIPLGE